MQSEVLARHQATQVAFIGDSWLEATLSSRVFILDASISTVAGQAGVIHEIARPRTLSKRRIL